MNFKITNLCLLTSLRGVKRRGNPLSMIKVKFEFNLIKWIATSPKSAYSAWAPRKDVEKHCPT